MANPFVHGGDRCDYRVPIVVHDQGLGWNKPPCGQGDIGVCLVAWFSGAGEQHRPVAPKGNDSGIDRSSNCVDAAVRFSPVGVRSPAIQGGLA